MTEEESKAYANYFAALMRAGETMRFHARPDELVTAMIDAMVGLVGYCEAAKIDGPAVRDAKEILTILSPATGR